MFENILIPLDGSELSERAISAALNITQYCEADLTFARVPVPEKPLLDTIGGILHITLDERYARAKEETNTYLELLEADYRHEPYPLMYMVLEGHDPALAVLEYSQRHHHDLIVLSSHGRSGIVRWALGSVAQRITTHAENTPVLLIRKPDPIQKILVPLDGSLYAENILDAVKTMAKTFFASVTLFHAGDDPIVQLEQSWSNPKEYLYDIAAEVEKEGISCDFFTTTGNPAVKVDEYAENHQFDLITMGTHGLNGLGRWRLGSVTHKLLHNTHHNLLIMPPQRY